MNPVKSKSTRNSRLIELELTEINQLFNSMDPSPFVAKDLDRDAEQFVVNWAQEYSPQDPLTLRIHLENWPAEDPGPRMTEAVHNFFAYRARLNRLEFRRLMQQGRTSLFIGLVFLAACLLIIRLLLSRVAGPWSSFVQESLTIAGWVGMWRPMEIFLHDWWPVRRRGRIYLKLSEMPVEVIRKTTR
jgi:hypothetical protein